ncbi:MAG TPA: chemotaxis response regulator protein-glutamate methylesterase [Clostridiales bacterium]|nr:chemotaxis response regulator protein-glutamate methylesterase [Clostridiales bacterium]
MSKLKVLIVDDSLFFRTILSNLLIKYPNIQVVGLAGDPFEAREKIAALNPDVVTLDINMPKMNGIDFLKEFLPKKWLPFVVISSRDDIVFEAMDAGAVDFVEKPTMQPGKHLDEFGREIAEKIKEAAQATATSAKKMPSPPKQAAPAFAVASRAAKPGFIVLGASTGGTEATSRVLKQLPANIPGMVIVQHMPPVFTDLYAQRLDRETKLRVKEASNGDMIKPGHAYVAPGDKHVVVEKRGAELVIRTNEGEKVNGHRPSVDVLFDSVVKFADKTTTAIILTGMGADGAKGITALRKRGAYTIGQDEATCVVYGMPCVAYQLGGIVKQAPLDGIPAALIERLNSL